VSQSSDYLYQLNDRLYQELVYIKSLSLSSDCDCLSSDCDCLSSARLVLVYQVTAYQVIVRQYLFSICGPL
jgi:hypothetical protein